MYLNFMKIVLFTISFFLTLNSFASEDCRMSLSKSSGFRYSSKFDENDSENLRQWFLEKLEEKGYEVSIDDWKPFYLSDGNTQSIKNPKNIKHIYFENEFKGDHSIYDYAKVVLFDSKGNEIFDIKTQSGLDFFPYHEGYTLGTLRLPFSKKMNLKKLLNKVPNCKN